MPTKFWVAKLFCFSIYYNSRAISPSFLTSLVSISYRNANPVMASMIDNVGKFSGISSMVIFANFMHRRFIMTHIVQEAFILMMVHSFFVKLWPFLGLWQFVSLYSRRWDSFKMAVDDFRWNLLMFSRDRYRGSTMGNPKSFFSRRWCQPLTCNS